jgi:hypothetical protein
LTLELKNHENKYSIRRFFKKDFRRGIQPSHINRRIEMVSFFKTKEKSTASIKMKKNKKKIKKVVRMWKKQNDPQLKRV